MFRFRGRLGGSEFAIGLATRVGLFIAFTVAYPYLLTGWLSGTACRGTGACGALALVASMYVKPIAYLALVFSLVPITVRRLRDAALPVWLTVVMVLLMLSDMGFATAMAAPWTVNFVTGGLMFAPLGLAIALMALIALTVFPSRQAGRSSMLARGLGVLLAVAVLLEMTLPTIAAATMPSPSFAAPAGGHAPGNIEEGSGRTVWNDRERNADNFMQSLMTALYWNMELQPYRVGALSVIALLFAAFVVSARRSPGSPGGSSSAGPTVSEHGHAAFGRPTASLRRGRASPEA